MSSELADIQRQFAAHLREPNIHPAPEDIEDRRMKIYRDLIYNNIERFISSAFPIIRKLYSDTHWHEMVRDFVHRHQSQTPYFLEISEEFLAYLEHERGEYAHDPLYLLELARYEWAELALFVADEQIPENEINEAAAANSLLEHIPVLSPLAWPMVFEYPVHRVGPQAGVDINPQLTCIVVYRNREDKVKFLESNTVTARLLALCDDNSERSGRSLLEQIANELHSDDPASVITGGAQTLAQLLGLDIIFARSNG